MSSFRNLVESSDTQRVMLDIENVDGLKEIAKAADKENFKKEIMKVKKLFRKKILFKNVDWDEVYDKLDITK